MEPNYNMPRRKLNYQEGDWIAVPLEQGGYCVGVIARCDRKGAILGYFFGPRIFEIPDISELSNFKASEAILIRDFGDLGLLDYGWPVIGKLDDWNSEQWPVPDFGYIDVVPPIRGFRRVYGRGIGELCTEEIQVSIEEAESLPQDGLSGYLALVYGLDKLL